MDKMTEKEMYGFIAEQLADNEAVVAFCEKKIGALEAKAARAKEKAAEKRAAGDELADAVYAAMSTEEFEPIATICGRIDGEDVTVGKVAYRLRTLAENGKAEKADITVPGADGTKTRKIVGYRAI